MRINDDDGDDDDDGDVDDGQVWKTRRMMMVTPMMLIDR